MVNILLIMIPILIALYLIIIFFEEWFRWYARKIQSYLDPADYPVSRFLLLELRAFGIVLLISLVLGKGLGVKIFVFILFSLIVIVFFPQYARVIRGKWIEKFNDQLEEALRLIVSGLRAGLGFTQCMKVVTDQMPSPVKNEFQKVLDEIALGVPVEEALEHLQNRIPSRELAIFASAVILQRRTGGALTEVLQNIAITIQSRRRLKRRINTLTAEGRLSAIVLVSLPFALLILLRITQPELFRPMLETIPGIVMLFIVVLLDTLAALWIRKIITIEI